MILRSLLSAAAALLLSGCTGWAAESRLIPVAARDSAGLDGTYASEEERVVFAPGEDGFVRGTDPAGEQPGGDLAFALLREEAPEPSAIAEALAEDGEEPSVDLPDRSYLMEVPWTKDDGKTDYFYGIVRIAFSPDGTAHKIKQFTVLCSKAAEKLAVRKVYEVCIFDDYARLRAAALDALAWYDDPRIALDTTTLQRESEPDAVSPAEP
jgi:hypothetical protein